MALTFHWGNTSRFVHWYFKCISFIAEKIEHLYRRVWDGSETRRSHTQKSAHRLHAAREDRTDSEAPGTSQPTAPTVPCLVVCLWNFTKHLPSSLWKKFVCYNGGDFRIWSRYNENLGKKWGSSENVVVFGGGGQCLISSGTAKSYIGESKYKSNGRNKNLRDL